jgi:hypothetical protein
MLRKETVPNGVTGQSGPSERVLGTILDRLTEPGTHACIPGRPRAFPLPIATEFRLGAGLAVQARGIRGGRRGHGAER